ncbi:MAG: VanZ family protein [Actinomycetaceae bacterium]|nr:VanZ family protein [Arcanobacterium sp.]MDD7686832.1 VanZ family protein [Actinomycetaceae bacterium]MDY5273585.1 VanZ family protein [Arcanobacterium sp.]
MTVSLAPVYVALAGAWITFYYHALADNRPRGGRLVAYLFFGLYVGIIVHFTLTPFLVPLHTAHFDVNLTPVVQSYLMVKYGIPSVALYNLVGNLLLFLPLGMMAPLAFSNMRSWWKVTGVLAVGSLCVESLQLIFTVRLFDVDDIILNTVGALLGYLICAGILMRIPALRRVADAWSDGVTIHESEAKNSRRSASRFSGARVRTNSQDRAGGRRYASGVRGKSRSNARRSGRNRSSAKRFPLTVYAVVGFAGFVALVIGVAFAVTMAIA